jgi:uncharacterized protein (DUF1697 family)
MPTHAALLRGINVGGRNTVVMADLRALLTTLGHTEVATYVASGNVVFTTDAEDPGALAATIERAITDELRIEAPVVVVPRDDFERIVAANPFPEPDDPRHVHVVFRSGQPTGAEVEAVAAAQREAAAGGSRDEARYVDRTLYLCTPDGFGRSRLAELLNRGPALRNATARNLRTVLRLRDMLDG